jgi:hypothetical protein
LLVAIYIIDISINRGDCLNPTVLDMSWLPRGGRLHLATGILVLQVHLVLAISSLLLLLIVIRLIVVLSVFIYLSV